MNFRERLLKLLESVDPQEDHDRAYEQTDKSIVLAGGKVVEYELLGSYHTDVAYGLHEGTVYCIEVLNSGAWDVSEVYPGDIDDSELWDTILALDRSGRTR